ncbi:MAG TPA: hypothetical protein VJA18_05615 [Candidatus Nanoarchaeia archaeon]|nr:hypothetical protein [Candidatus Nanoarchaeia archaeon]
MVLETLAKQILGLVNWGITILGVMIVWEFFQLVKLSGGGVAGGALNAGKWIRNLPRRYARRSHKRLLNDYVSENREEKSLDSLKNHVLHLLTELEAVGARGQLSQNQQSELLNWIRSVGEMLNETKRYFRDVTRNTSRAWTGLDKMFDYFKAKGMKIPEAVTVAEKQILDLHEETAQDLTRVQENYAAIVKSKELENLEALKQPDFAGGYYKIRTNSEPFNDGHLTELIKGFQNEKFLLEDAYEKQKQAKMQITGIIQSTRGLYEQ